jgi:hypothetical protein
MEGLFDYYDYMMMVSANGMKNNNVIHLYFQFWGIYLDF